MAKYVEVQTEYIREVQTNELRVVEVQETGITGPQGPAGNDGQDFSAEIDALSGAIDSNTADITSNTSDIADISAALATAGVDVSGNLTDEGIAVWNATTEKFDSFPALKYDGTTLRLTGGDYLYTPLSPPDWSFAGGTPTGVQEGLDDLAGEVTNLAGAGVETFDELTDTPGNKVGADGRAVVVSGTNLAYVDLTTPIAAASADANLAYHTALQTTSTSILSGGVLETSGAANTQFILNAGTGNIIDHETPQPGFTPPRPTVTPVSWATQLVSIPGIATGEFSFVLIDNTGTPEIITEQLPTPEDSRNKLIVGKVIHRGGTIQFVVNLHHKSQDVYNQFGDLAEALGTINIAGNVVEPADPSNDLSIKKTAGSSFRINVNQHTDIKNPHTTDETEQDPATFFRVYRDGSGGWTYVSGQTQLDPTQYDDGSGTLQPVPGGFFPDYTVQRIYMFPGSGRIYVMYGQDVYTTFDNALEGIQEEQFDGPPLNFFDASLRGWAIVRRDQTDFSVSGFSRIIQATRFGAGGGAGGIPTGVYVEKMGDTMSGDLTISPLSGSAGNLVSVDVNGKLQASSVNSSDVTGALQILEKTQEPTGFVNTNKTTTISVDDGTRTLTISGNNFEVYVRGELYTYNVENVVWDDIEGAHFITIDPSGNFQSAHVSEFATFDDIVNHIIRNNAFVAEIQWDRDNGRSLVFDERHGCVMDGDTHYNLHISERTRYLGGLIPGDFDSNGNGDDESAAQFSVTAGQVLDEDIMSDIEAKLVAGDITTLYLSGAGAWRWESSAAPIISAGSGRAAWNENVGGNWQLTEVDNNDFVLAHIFAGPTILGGTGVFAIMGQGEYNSTGDARAAAPVEINNIITTGLPQPEFVAIATIIYQTGNGYDNTWKSRVRTTGDGEDFINWLGQDINPVSGISNHNQLAGLQGGDAAEYYHLTLAELNDLPNKVTSVEGITGAVDISGVNLDVSVSGQTIVLSAGVGGGGGSGTGRADQSFTYADISASSNVLTITHALADQYVDVSVYDSNDKEVIPDDVTALNANQVSIDFGTFTSADITGVWNVGIISSKSIEIDNRYDQSFTWADISGSNGVLSVPHNLMVQYVDVSIYDDNNEEVIADSIIASSTTELSADFNSYGEISGTWNVGVIK